MQWSSLSSVFFFCAVFVLTQEDFSLCFFFVPKLFSFGFNNKKKNKNERSDIEIIKLLKVLFA